MPALQTALAAAPDGGEIWVAAGVHYPDDGPGLEPGNPSHSFHLGKGLRLLGGFAGTESSADQRNPRLNPTILSGDIDHNDQDANEDAIRADVDEIQGDNAWHLLTCGLADLGPERIDGFIITGGDSSRATGDGFGAGLVTNGSSVEVTRCRFVGNRGNWGGAAFVEGGSPSFRECDFLANEAGIAGAFLNFHASPSLERCRFRGNVATQPAGTGGAMVNYTYKNAPGLSYRISQCEFSGNSAASGGAVLCTGVADIGFEGCTFAGNAATGTGGALAHGEGASPALTNCILFGNRAAGSSTVPGATVSNMPLSMPTFRHCLVAASGGSGGWNPGLGVDLGHNLDQDPRFARPVETAPSIDGDHRLLTGSPAINTGLNSAVISETDLAGRPRIADGTVDLGALEGAFCSFTSSHPGLAASGDDNRNGRSNFLDFVSGSDPAAIHDPATVPSITCAGGEIHYRFTLRPDAVDADGVLRCSADLSTWVLLVEGSDFDVLSVDDLSAGCRAVTVKLRAGAEPETSCFLRIDFPDP